VRDAKGNRVSDRHRDDMGFTMLTGTIGMLPQNWGLYSASSDVFAPKSRRGSRFCPRSGQVHSDVVGTGILVLVQLSLNAGRGAHGSLAGRPKRRPIYADFLLR
jgi:hypothetical protein